jgi:hypothetical protein
LQQCDIMNELVSPLSDGDLLTSENFPISDYPNIPWRCVARQRKVFF